MRSNRRGGPPNPADIGGIAMKLFPAIDLYTGWAVRLYKGDYNQMTVYDKDPLAVAERFRTAGAEYLHMVDLDGKTSEKKMKWFVASHFEILDKLMLLKQADFLGCGLQTGECPGNLRLKRIREELAAGKNLRTAVSLGYDKAFSAVFDGNITTLLVGLILIVVGFYYLQLSTKILWENMKIAGYGKEDFEVARNKKRKYVGYITFGFTLGHGLVFSLMHLAHSFAVDCYTHCS